MKFGFENLEAGMVECADKMLRKWANWLECRVRLLGYPSSAAFASEGCRGSLRPAPIVDKASGRVHDAVLLLMVEGGETCAVLLAHYLMSGTIDSRLKHLGIGRNRYYDLLDAGQRTIMRYVAERKRYGA